MDVLCDCLNNKTKMSVHGVQDLHSKIEKYFISEGVAILESSEQKYAHE